MCSHGSREQKQWKGQKKQWKGQKGKNLMSCSLRPGAESLQRMDLVSPKNGEMIGCLEIGIPKWTPRGQHALGAGRLENKKIPIFLLEREE